MQKQSTKNANLSSSPKLGYSVPSRVGALPPPPPLPLLVPLCLQPRELGQIQATRGDIIHHAHANDATVASSWPQLHNGLYRGSQGRLGSLLMGPGGAAPERLAGSFGLTAGRNGGTHVGSGSNVNMPRGSINI